MNQGRDVSSANKQAPAGVKRKVHRAFPGDGGLDFQEEVVRVPKAIGHALDDLDAVVNALEDAGTEPIKKPDTPAFFEPSDRWLTSIVDTTDS
jgi:hypothetical protein